MNLTILTGDIPINYNKFQQLLIGINNKYTPLRIATMGKTFLDKKIQNFCNQYDVNYNLFKLFHQSYDTRCVLKPYYYNKQFSHSNYFIVVQQALKWCNTVILAGIDKKTYIYVNNKMKTINNNLPSPKNILYYKGK